MIKKYYIEKVKKHDDEMVTIILSTYNHYRCIKIHGNRQEATNRAMIILSAFNKE